MEKFPNCRKLLDGVVARLWLAKLGRRWRWIFLTLCVVYTIALIVSRSTGWWAGQFNPIHLPILIVAAFVLSILTHRKPSYMDAARRVDEFGQTRDLFLTITMLQNSAGEFQPLVIKSAEATATKFKAGQLVQFPWQKPFLQAAVAMLIVGTAVWQFPQLDPFGTVAEAKEQEQRSTKLNSARLATKERMAELKKAEEDAKEAAEVSKALEKLKNVLGSLEKNKPGENRTALAGEQKKVGALWRKISAEKMAEMLMKSQTDQAFGEPGKDSQQKWAKELAEGNADSLRKEISEMKELADKIDKAKDPAEKAELKSELKKKMQQMKEFAAEKLQNKALKAALDRALEQLESTKQEKLEKESKEGLKESMELIKQELKQMEMSAQEMKQLEEALKTIQMAKQLNEEGKLETEGDNEGMSLEEYREFYEELMEQGEEDGEGTGDQGMGNGTPVDEDETAKTGFKPEQSKSAVKAGKMLLSINTKGLPPDNAEAEEIKTKYRKLVQTVKSTAEEAIQQEQIPPGYHDGIKNYFNSLEEAPVQEKAPGK